ncbi:MAG: hypothetical protein GY743_23445 [Planctomycetaceae bacterium]|nr:hypothetical protein [Planctomycetaceae bacterium]
MYTTVETVENAINKWLAENDVSPADIVKITQSEQEGHVTISIFYITRETETETETWLTENLPETNPPASCRPGAEYGVITNE